MNNQKKMQVVLLAGGKSSRMYPFTEIAHKSLITLMGKTIIEHTLESIKKTGLEDIIIVRNSDDVIEKIIGDGKRLGLTIRYVVQPEALGMGDALNRVKEYITGSFLLAHAAHIDFADFFPLFSSNQVNENEMLLLGKQEEDVSQFGVLEVTGDKVISIVEKPKKGEEPSHIRLIGMYLIPEQFLNTLEAVPVEEYSFETAITQYAKKYSVRFIKTDMLPVTVKYPWDLLRAATYLLSNITAHIADGASVSEKAHLEGTVFIEDGATILEGAVIKGPVYVGKNAKIGTNAIVRDHTILEENTVVGAHMEMRNSILLRDATTHSGFIGDSVIGSESKIAAGIHTANVRIDRATVKVVVGDKKRDTGLKRLGIITGSSVKTGIHVSTMPGVIIGENTIIGPGTTVMKNVPANVSYYTKFHEIIEEKREEK